MKPSRRRSTKAAEGESLGQRIRRLRQLRGLTIMQLAARSRSSAGYISQLENDPNKSMSLDKAKTFAKALEVPEHVLLGSLAADIPPDDREFIAWFLELPPDAKNTFKALMDWYQRGKGK
jgi:transcriptional regulator with XRE-family HTH domain